MRGFFGLMGSYEPLSLSLTSNSIGLSILNAGRMAGDADAHRQAELEALLVGKAELSCQLVYPDLLGQSVRLVLCLVRCAAIRR